MRWQLEHGERAEFLESLPQDVLPSALIERPDLWPENAESWRAFLALHASRQAGMAPCAILVSEVAAYAAMTQHPEPLRLLSDVQAMDRVWLNWQADKRQQRDGR